ATGSYFTKHASGGDQGAEEPVERLPPRGGAWRGGLGDGPGQGRGRAAAPNDRDAPKPARTGAVSPPRQGLAGARPATIQEGVPPDQGGDKGRYAGAARRRTRRVMPLYAESSAVLRWLFNENQGAAVFAL